MKRYVLSMMLAVMLLPTGLVAQGPEREEMEFQREMRGRELEMQKLESEMDFHRKMQELELEKNKIELEHLRRSKEEPAHAEPHRKDGPHPLLLLVLVVNILTAVWVFQDIRQRGCGSGIWIVIALLTGLLGTLVYAIVRLSNGEKKKS
jgi:hypothetical protein